MDPFDSAPEIRILTFTGPSGVGKTTVIDALMRLRPELERVISCTTRPRRDEDPVGEYAYLSDEDFDELVERKAFLWTGAYAANRYGTMTRSVEEALSARYPRIMTLMPDKTALLRSLYPERVLSFLVTASDDAIRARLRTRGDSEEDIALRLSANREWTRDDAFSSVPYVVIVNDGTPEEAAHAVIEAAEACRAIA